MGWFESGCQRVVVGGKSSTSTLLTAGVPQGSILGPLLFLIFINDMTDELDIETHLFADDTNIVETMDDTITSINRINHNLTTLSLWADQWRVTFNALKTHFMRISNKINKPPLPKLYLNHVEIKEVSTCTTLGIILNNTLTWGDHITNIQLRASKRLTIINRYRHALPRQALETLYISMVRPVIEYGDILYDNCTLSSGQSLELLQRRAALICTGAYRHTESQDLLQELGWAPLHKRCFAHKMVHFFKIINHIYPNYLYNLLTPTANTTYNSGMFTFSHLATVTYNHHLTHSFHQPQGNGIYFRPKLNLNPITKTQNPSTN